jgi:TolA-binding protein
MIHAANAPDSLFFLGSALTDLGKNAEACEAFAELAKAYPDAASGRLADRVASGKTRAKCK